MTLCKSEEDFLKVLKYLKVKEIPQWIPEGGAACVRPYRKKGELLCIVCIEKPVKKTPSKINAILVHEAVHVWQAYRDEIGELKPASEQEAYSIQCISENLMEEYWKKPPTLKKRKKKK